MVRIRVTPYLALLLSLACSDGAAVDDGGPGTLTTTPDTVNGVLWVRNSGDPPAWTATLIARIGSLDGGPEEFGRIRSLAADAAGNVYVADNLAHEIRVFDPEGRHLRTIGRTGEGPGEFRDLYSLAWLEGDIAAMDPRNARISVLNETGDWIRGIQHYAITGPATLIRLHPLGDGGFYVPTVDPASRRLPFVRITDVGPADTIFPPEAPPGARQAGVLCRRSDGGLAGISVPEAPAVVYAFPPPGGLIAASWTERYEVSFLTPSGDTTRVVAREGTLAPYSDSLWAEAMEPYREMHRNYPGSECDPAEPTRPESRAALRYLAFDEGGRMWVEAATAQGFAWEVFDPAGRLLGRAPAPPRSTTIPPYVRDGRIYQVEADELGVEYVAVYWIGPSN
jgi:hypothetical protein